MNSFFLERSGGLNSSKDSADFELALSALHEFRARENFPPKNISFLRLLLSMALKIRFSPQMLSMASMKVVLVYDLRVILI